jgi:uncharacterized membrane protein
MSPAHREAARNRVALYMLWALILIFAVGASAYSILRHMNRQSTILDLGIQTQVVWNTAQGRPFESSIEVRNYLGDHLSLILALLAPLYWVWPDVRLLLVFQAVVLALGAYPVYRLAREELSDERVGLVFALAYLLYPAVGFIVRFDFHAMALVAPLLLAGLWCWRSRKTSLALLWFLLALLCREEIGLVLAALGVILALRSRGSERRLAWLLGAIGLVWTILGMGFVMPYLRGQPSDTFVACFDHLGASYGEGLLRLVRDPFGALGDSWQGIAGYKATLLPRLLLPVAFLSLLAPGLLVPLLPSLLPAVFSRCLPHSTIYYQYTAPMIPVVFWAAIVGFRRAEGGLRRLLRRTRASGVLRGVLLLLVLLGTASALVWDFPLWKPVQGPGLYAVGRPEPRANDAAFYEAAALIPPDATLATDNHLGPHLAHRRAFYFFPYFEAWRADYILVDLQDDPSRADVRGQTLERLLGCSAMDPAQRFSGLARDYCGVQPNDFVWYAYGVRYWQDGILLLQRGWPVNPVLHMQVRDALEW